MDNNKALEKAILKLRAQKNNDFRALKSQLEYSYLELKPSRILKRVYIDIKSEPELKNNLLESVISLAGGYLSKRLLIGKSSSFIKSIIFSGVARKFDCLMFNGFCLMGISNKH